MTHIERLRRVGILCCHCLRNLCFYRSGWENGKLIQKSLFWVNANGNFLDICVMEWCKVFGDARGKHYWKKVITDQESFFKNMLIELNISENDFDSYIREMKTYRDKFVAHLDSENIAHIPKLEVVRKSISYLYDYLLAYEEVNNCFSDAPKNSLKIYNRFLNEGKLAYNSKDAT